MSHVIAVCSQKGGVGKTTIAMGLAAVFAETARVMLLDIDPQQSATDWAEAAGETLPFDFAASSDASELASIPTLEYDVIVVDTPGYLANDGTFEAVFASANLVVLPAEPAALSIRPLLRSIREVVEPSQVDYRVVVSRIQRGAAGQADADDLRAILAEEALPLFTAGVREYKTHTTAPIEGLVATSYPQSRPQQRNAATDIRNLATEILALWSFAPESVDVTDHSNQLAGA